MSRWQLGPAERRTLFYPLSVRVEKEAHNIKEDGGVLPVLNRTIGTPVPDFTLLLKDHPEKKVIHTEEQNSIWYEMVSAEDYQKIGRYLTANGYHAAELKTEMHYRGWILWKHWRMPWENN